MAVALPKETFEKLWAGSEIPFRGASRLYYSSFFRQLQSPVPCLGLLLPLDIYVQSHSYASVKIIFFPSLYWVLNAVWSFRFWGWEKRNSAWLNKLYQRDYKLFSDTWVSLSCIQGQKPCIWWLDKIQCKACCHVSREGCAVLMKEVHKCSLHQDRIRVQPRHMILFPPLDKES